jgi:hypothetical protein
LFCIAAILAALSGAQQIQLFPDYRVQQGPLEACGTGQNPLEAGVLGTKKMRVLFFYAKHNSDARNGSRRESGCAARKGHLKPAFLLPSSRSLMNDSEWVVESVFTTRSLRLLGAGRPGEGWILDV